MAGKWLEHGLRTLEIHSFSLYFMRESVLVDATTFPQKPDPSKPWQRASIGEDGSYWYMRCFCRRFWSIPGSHSTLINWPQNKPSDTMSYFTLGGANHPKTGGLWFYRIIGDIRIGDIRISHSSHSWPMLTQDFSEKSMEIELLRLALDLLEVVWGAKPWWVEPTFTGFVATWESDLSGDPSVSTRWAGKSRKSTGGF